MRGLLRLLQMFMLGRAALRTTPTRSALWLALVRAVGFRAAVPLTVGALLVQWLMNRHRTPPRADQRDVHRQRTPAGGDERDARGIAALNARAARRR